MNKKGHITLIEMMIVVAIFGLIAAIAIPILVGNRDKAAVEALYGNPRLQNDKLLEIHKVKRIFEINGYDVYVFMDGKYSVAIPATNSVYQLERK